ncbi:lantibiotic dehydratase [Streptacidiphilus cavernicola]|uniref:Lantibiotic dehydratase n=1 Tax=Streptacidiphilus cavernicola TaxID=3342716 RepID=A0ABV6VZ98_9ACTN
MPHSAGPGSDDGYAVRSAPYALLRSTVLRYPAQSQAAAVFRAELARLTALEAEAAALLPRLCDDLYAARGGHLDTVHRDVVLPLRRALHNGREPRPALLDRLGDLPERVPRLAEWLALRGWRSAMITLLGKLSDGALTAERDALAVLCGEPALRRAVALTSSDLLRAVDRASSGVADRKARKEEPGVLRQVLRAGTKTSPLSWFTAVGWGLCDPSSGDGSDLRAWEQAGLSIEGLTSVVKVNRTLVSALTEALLDDPGRRSRLPHRMASSARIADGRAAYARGRVRFAGGRYLVTAEDEVELAAAGPLELIDAHCEKPSSLGELANKLVAALDGAAGTDATRERAADAFLARLAAAGLLVPTEPVDPQHEDPLTLLAAWLRAESDGARLALAVDEIADRTREFSAAEPPRRPAVLAGLAEDWRTLLAEAGRPVPADSAPLNVLSEDVVAPRPVRLDGLLGDQDHRALGEVTALAELFDLGHLMRRIARDRFVARYGPGGSCRHPWEFGVDIAEAWEEAGQLAALGPGHHRRFPTGVEELAALRGELLDAVEVAPDGDVMLPVDAVRALGGRLPRWMRQRPASYSYFLQRGTPDGLLCVNHVYGGWGRFTSRFLGAMEPAARIEVAGQIRRGLAEGARAVQVRPVGGFNANLHPLLVPDEIGPDRRWTSIGEPEVELVHDRATDQLRLRLCATGELLDVLYGGFLAPIMLPRRIAALLSDHPHGVVDFRSLVPTSAREAPGGPVVRTPRLRHRHLVLQRRRWHLPPGVVRTLRAELGGGSEAAVGSGGVPAAVVARWRALLDLPEQVFLHPAAVPAPAVAPAAPAAQAGRSGRATEEFLTHLGRPKPQFVDLGNALHLRSLAKWLARHPDGATLEEALPAPGGRDRAAPAVELVAETYRAGAAS